MQTTPFLCYPSLYDHLRWTQWIEKGRRGKGGHRRPEARRAPRRCQDGVRENKATARGQKKTCPSKQSWRYWRVYGPLGRLRGRGQSFKAVWCELSLFCCKQCLVISAHPLTLHTIKLLFFPWNISVICLTVLLKLAITVFLSYIFKYYDRNDLIFGLGPKNDRIKKTTIKTHAVVSFLWLAFRHWTCKAQLASATKSWVCGHPYTFGGNVTRFWHFFVL